MKTKIIYVNWNDVIRVVRYNSMNKYFTLWPHVEDKPLCMDYVAGEIFQIYK